MTQGNKEPSIAELNTEIKLVKKDVTSINQLLERLDTAIEKLTELSNAVNKIIAVHETRLEQNEKSFINLKQNTDNELAKSHSILLKTSQDNYEELIKRQDSHDKRLSKLESKYWWLLGAGAAIGAILVFASQILTISF